jgi:hypothetical protein
VIDNCVTCSCFVLGAIVRAMPRGSQIIHLPFDTRTYVGPAGERAQLVAALMLGPWPEPRWRVSLLNDRNVTPIPGVMAIVHVGDREMARRIYRERLMALKAAGWRRA